MKGFYELTRLSDGRTKVDYRVGSDPGGTLPDWLAKRATRELPVHTIVNLRRQVARTRGAYGDVVRAWSAKG